MDLSLGGFHEGDEHKTDTVKGTCFFRKQSLHETLAEQVFKDIQNRNNERIRSFHAQALQTSMLF